MSIGKSNKQLNRQLEQADTYEEWYAAAEELDRREGWLDWRESPDHDFFHDRLMRTHLLQMQHHRRQGEMERLTALLQESLYRHIGELSNPALYQYARTGTKTLVTEYLDEIARTMQFLCDHPVPHISTARKLAQFEQAEKVFGRPALMLSGGAAFGIYHLGVTKALWQQGLLPNIIAGSSMGAIVAAGICNRTDDELKDFFTYPEKIHVEALRWLPPRQMLKSGSFMDSDQLLHHIRTNVGAGTFLSSYRRSGRILNISVSPTRARQKPRLLNYMTAPDVLLDSATLASCAIPGIYSPVALQARNPRGEPIPYMATETWVDGTVHGDLPILRMARLHNVNQSIVSQANPHVIPFITHRQHSGPLALLKHSLSSIVHTGSAEVLDVTRELFNGTRISPWLDQAHAVAAQTYLGDINIQFPFKPLLYRKVASNPTAKDLAMYIRLGERATWPQIAMIRDLTRISRVFPVCIQKLRQQMLDAGEARRQSDKRRV